MQHDTQLNGVTISALCSVVCFTTRQIGRARLCDLDIDVTDHVTYNPNG